jgi:hypothetical protein
LGPNLTRIGNPGFGGPTGGGFGYMWGTGAAQSFSTEIPSNNPTPLLTTLEGQVGALEAGLKNLEDQLEASRVDVGGVGFKSRSIT